MTAEIVLGTWYENDGSGVKRNVDFSSIEIGDTFSIWGRVGNIRANGQTVWEDVDVSCIWNGQTQTLRFGKNTDYFSVEPSDNILRLYFVSSNGHDLQVSYGYTEKMTVFKQLSDYCDCLKVKESDVNELINLISVKTCWASKENICGTFLTGERTEVVELPNCVCDCDVFTFEPQFAPFEPDSFTFTVIEQEGITETSTEVTDFIYSAVDEVFRIQLPLPECGCSSSCGCEKKYKLLVTYIAGYELIPECLLPVFCEALQWIQIKNTCDCSECEPCNSDNTEVGEIDYSTLTGRLQDYFLETLSVQYERQLSFISVCKWKSDLWAVVV